MNLVYYFLRKNIRQVISHLNVLVLTVVTKETAREPPASAKANDLWSN